MRQPQNNIKAIVLSGGGAHGAYEVGVLKALLTGKTWMTSYAPFDPDVVSGTSIGACNAAALVSQLEVEDPAAVASYLEYLWVDVIPRDGDTGHNHVYRFRGNPA